MSVYVKNSDLLREIIASKEQNKLTDTAVIYLQKMVKECVRVLRYKASEDKEDCMQFAILDVLQYWNRFDPNKSSNAFSYFTQIIKNGLAKGLKKLFPIKSTKIVRISMTDGIYNL